MLALYWFGADGQHIADVFLHKNPHRLPAPVARAWLTTSSCWTVGRCLRFRQPWWAIRVITSPGYRSSWGHCSEATSWGGRRGLGRPPPLASQRQVLRCPHVASARPACHRLIVEAQSCGGQEGEIVREPRDYPSGTTVLSGSGTKWPVAESCAVGGCGPTGCNGSQANAPGEVAQEPSARSRKCGRGPKAIEFSSSTRHSGCLNHLPHVSHPAYNARRHGIQTRPPGTPLP